MTEPNHVAAARLLGMKPSEIVAVETVDGDLVITTHDQVRTVIVPDDNPDGAGRTGRMIAALPAGFPVGAEFPVPVFTPRHVPDDEPAAGPVDEDLAEIEADDVEDDDTSGDPYAGSVAELDDDTDDDEPDVRDAVAAMRKADLIAFAAETAIDLDGATRVDDIRARILAALDPED